MELKIGVDYVDGCQKVLVMKFTREPGIQGGNVIYTTQATEEILKELIENYQLTAKRKEINGQQRTQEHDQP